MKIKLVFLFILFENAIIAQNNINLSIDTSIFERLELPYGNEKSVNLYDSERRLVLNILIEKDKITEVCFMNDSKPNGLRISYFADGRIKSQSNYLNGVQIGLFREYYANGIKKMEGKYSIVDDSNTPLVIWDTVLTRESDGTIIEKIIGKTNTRLTGKYFEYFENGQIKIEEYYDEKGNLIIKKK